MSVPSPAPLIEMATAYWHSATLITATQLDVFTKIDEGATDVHGIATAIGASAEMTDMLLTALLSLGLLNRVDDRYENGDLAEAFLISGRPGYLGPALAYNGDVFRLWSNLGEVVTTGKPQRPPSAYLGDDKTRTKNFVYGMHHRALAVGRAVISKMDFGACTRLADIGGGPGTYSALLCERSPNLHADVLDLQSVVEIASQLVIQSAAADRISCRAFDYTSDDLDGMYDGALISGVLHREGPDAVRSILSKVASALKPGSPLYISDVMLDDQRDGPVFAAMFALNMRILAEGGRCHSVAEQGGWLDETGFDVVQSWQLPAPIHYTVIEAKRR